MPDLLLGIDVGTTGVKAIVFDTDGAVLGQGFHEYGIIRNNKDYAEQDAAQIWEETKKVIRQAAATVGMNITALSVSVQGDAVICVDSNGDPLSNAQLGMDYRGKTESELAEQVLGKEYLFKKTGMAPHPLNSFIKMLWVQSNDPDLYARTYKFVTYSDFILKKLGSDGFFIDLTMASRTMCMELETLTWSEKILNAFDFDSGKLSQPVPSGTVVGKISPTVAAAVGISPDCRLVAGGHDQTCAALGAGLIKEDIALDSHGTAEVISTAFSAIRNNDVMMNCYYPCYAHTVRGMYFTFALNHCGGISLRWFKESFCGEETYDEIFAKMSDSVSGILALPHFTGSGTPTCNFNSSGTFSGIRLTTTRYDLAKAILEGLACEMRINIDHFARAGISVNELRCVGGGARSEKGLQLKADVLGLPIATLTIREAACLGAAMLAGVGTGIYKNAYAAAAALVKISTMYTPRQNVHAAYNDQYGKYLELYRFSCKD